MRRFVLSSVLLAACAAPGEELEDPNAGLLRDFLDGKYDAAGHPLNAKVIELEEACGSERLAAACELAIPEGARAGDLIANLRLRVHAHAERGAIVTLRLHDDRGAELAAETLTVDRLRVVGDWIDLPVRLPPAVAAAARVAIEPAAGAALEADYVEIFPGRFGLVVSPGSGVLADDERLTLELPRGRRLERLEADGIDLRPVLEDLLDDGRATRTTTAFRTLIEVAVGDLLPARAEVTELHVRAGHAARIQIRRAPPPCTYEGEGARRVLVTGFQPFPADGWHANVSEVAVTALDPARIRGARVMRLVLPVEYDRAAAAIAEVIDRCEPDTVISFGQGGGAIALEETAYNLQDTGEIAGGVPDNRGIIRAATAIDPAAPATRDTLLPLAAIREALEAIGERPRDSDDPGRYICNNVMFSNVGIMQARGGRAGFVHLPYTDRFDDGVRARFARVVEAAIQATVDER